MAQTTHPHAPAPPGPDRTATRARGVGQAATLLVGLGGGLVALRSIGVHAPPCPFRTATGVPCPGCGMTRMADAVVHGRIADAATHDPAGVAILVGLLLLAATYVVQVLVRKEDPPAWMGSRWVIVGFVALGVAHWITTGVNGFLPPG